MNGNVLCAIFKRNFIAYFSSPTGYVFICVFVAMCSGFAFWPNEFFNANLANLDQLSWAMPYIMLVFIPAIAMSIWSEERRQGTDELLLTIPATDLDVVVGKFLAALAIFSVSLFFSMFSNYCVLLFLGGPDLGLFVGTYIGYWMVGSAMLSIGMVASFLTSNLTVGFVLGVVFNLPLALSGWAEGIFKNPLLAQTVRQWMITEQMQDFERGVLSISSFAYFTMIVVVMLYLSIVLIGRRHWMGGRDGHSMFGHYLARILALVVMAVGVNMLLANHDVVRVDITSARLSSLSSDTKKLIRELDSSTIKIEAYISPRVPPEYVQTRLNLLAMLDELQSLGGNKILVEKHSVENFSEAAVAAEEKYGIKPQTILSKSRGARKQEDIFMGVAFTCDLEKVVLPFVDKGLPAEYELVRSICTVAQQKRKKIGVLKTDAPLFGQFNMQTMSSGSDQDLIDELKKQYEVEEVDPTEPISKKYDVLLAVQPSSLAPPQLDNFIAAVKSGQPTAIFEDPLPAFWNGVPGTGQPRRPPQMNPMMMMGRQPQAPPKGNVTKLWDVLGIDLSGEEIVWQDFNPYRKAEHMIEKEWVFIDSGSGNESPFSQVDPISSKLQQVLFVFPGSIRKLNSSKMDFGPLASTGERTGTIEYQQIVSANRGGGPGALDRSRVPTQEKYNIAVRIRGKLSQSGSVLDDGKLKGAEILNKSSSLQTSFDEQFCADEDASDSAEGTEDTDEAGATDDDDPKIDVVLVADIDCLVSAFFQLRSRGDEQEDEIQWDFDNVTFVLNTLDVLADDDRFVEIRKRRRPHRTLETIDDKTEVARNDASEEREKFNAEFEAARDEAQQDFNKRIKKIEDRKDLNRVEKQIQLQMVRENEQRKLNINLEKLRQKRDRDLKQIERDLEMEIRSVQDSYKMQALIYPPIPPLLLAFFVFFYRRQQEREGVSKERLR